MRIKVYIIYAFANKVSKRIIKKLNNKVLVQSNTPLGRILDERIEFKHIRMDHLGSNVNKQLIQKASSSDVFIILWSTQCYNKGLRKPIKIELHELAQKDGSAFTIPVYIGNAKEKMLQKHLLPDSTSNADAKRQFGEIIYKKIKNRGIESTCNEILSSIFEITSIPLRLPRDYKSFYQEGSEFLNELLKKYRGGIYLTQTNPETYARILKRGIQNIERTFFATLKQDWYNRIFVGKDLVANQRYLLELNQKASQLEKKNARRLWIGNKKRGIRGYITERKNINKFIKLNSAIDLFYIDHRRLPRLMRNYGLLPYIPDMAVFDDVLVVSAREGKTPLERIDTYFVEEDETTINLIEFLKSLCDGAPSNGVLTKSLIIQQLKQKNESKKSYAKQIGTG